MATKKLQILNSLVSHDTLTNLDAPDQHPIEAVAGLRNELDSKASLVDGKVPVEQLPDDIGGDVAWEDIKNKPFGETGFKIEWDGTPTEPFIDVSDTMGAIIYKVGESKTKDELLGATCRYYLTSDDATNEFVVASSSITDSSSENFFIIFDGSAGVFAVSLEAGVYDFMGIQFDVPCAGTWFVKSSSYYPIYLASSDYSIKYLDRKYIPSDIGTWEGMSDKPFYETGYKYEWDGTSTDGIEVLPIDSAGITLYKISDNAISKDESIGATVNYSDGTFTVEESMIMTFDGGDSNSFMIMNASFPYVYSIFTAETITFSGMSVDFPSAGVWFTELNGDSLYTTAIEKDYSIKKIDNKFLPEDFGGSGADLSNYYTKSEIDNNLAVKADLVDGKVSAEQLPDIASSWNDLEDKPFYENGWEITWDGTPPTNEDEIIPAEAMGATLYKVGDAKTSEEVLGATCKYILGDGEEEFIVAAESIQTVNENFFVVFDGSAGIFAVALESGLYEFMGLQFDVKVAGTYFVDATDSYRPTYLGKIDIKKLDSKFIPSEIGTWENMSDKPFYEIGWSVEWDGVSSEYDPIDIRDTLGCMCYKVGEKIEKDDIIGCTVTMSDNETIIIDVNMITDFNEKTFAVLYDSTPVLFVSSDKNTIDLSIFGLTGQTLEVPFDGLWFYLFNDGLFTKSITSPDYEIVKIDEKFLPEGIGGDIAGCPIYSGGYLMENDMIVCNYYGLLNSMKEDYSFDMNAGVYDITANNFIMTFMPADDIAESNDYITIKIATGSVGADLNTGYFTSDLEVELNSSRKLESGSWYTIYCLYVERTDKWVGYFTMPKNDITTLENTVNNLESRIDSIVNNRLPLKQDVSNLVTDITNISTDAQYPSAKLLYDIKTNYDNILQFDTAPTANSEKLLKSGAIATALNKKADTTTLNTQVNNLTTEINKKATQTALDTAVSDLTTEIGKKANSDSVYSKSEIDGLITGVFYYKGSVDTFAELPATANVGDTYNIKNADAANNVKAGDNVVWCEIDGVGYWDVLSGIVDLSAYETAEEIQDKLDEMQDQLDEKANKTDLNNYLTNTEIQIELEKKANKNEIPSLEGVAMETDLAKVALSNDYLDLDNKPFYTVGIDQTITYNGSYNTNTTPHYLSYYYTKCGEYLASKTVQEYIDGFDSLVYGGLSYSSTNVNMNQAWQKQSNGIVSFKNQLLRAGAFVVIVPEDNLVYDLQSSSTSKITFNTKGIYCLLDEGDRSAFTSRVIFKTINIPLDKKYLPKATDNALGGVMIGDSLNIDSEGKLNYTLPSATTNSLGGVKVGDNLSISEDGTISATSLNWDNVEGKPELYTKDEVYTKSEVNVIKSNLETSINTAKTTLTNSINTKVDKVEGSRLMTNAEGTKLVGIEENANNYTLPAATTSSLGGVKVGANLSVAADGTISATSLDWNNINNKPELYNKSEIDSSLDEKQDKSNLVTDISLSSTDEQYPSAKLLYNTKTNLQTQINERQLISNLVTSVDENSTDTQYPSAKLLYDIIGDCDVVLNEINTLIGE